MGEATTFLIRFSGDLSTKRGRAFARFRSRLASNLRDALNRSDLPFELQLARNRFFLQAPSEAGEILPTIFGIQSYSPCANAAVEGLRRPDSRRRSPLLGGGA